MSRGLKTKFVSDAPKCTRLQVSLKNGMITLYNQETGNNEVFENNGNFTYSDITYFLTAVQMKEVKRGRQTKRELDYTLKSTEYHLKSEEVSFYMEGVMVKSKVSVSSLGKSKTLLFVDEDGAKLENKLSTSAYLYGIMSGLRVKLEINPTTLREFMEFKELMKPNEPDFNISFVEDERDILLKSKYFPVFNQYESSDSEIKMATDFAKELLQFFTKKSERYSDYVGKSEHEKTKNDFTDIEESEEIF